MKLRKRLNRLKLAPNSVGKYKTLKRDVCFVGKAGIVGKGNQVRILDVGMFGVRVQIPSLNFTTAQLAHNAIKW